MTELSAEIFSFIIDDQQFAIHLTAVDRVISAVAVTQVPNAPLVIHGIFDYHGVVVPVINLRRRLKMPEQPVRIGDVFILADTKKRKLALVADSAHGIVHARAAKLIKSSDIDNGFEPDGILQYNDGILFIYDIEKFISKQEEMELQEAIDEQNEVKNKPSEF